MLQVEQGLTRGQADVGVKQLEVGELDVLPPPASQVAIEPFSLDSSGSFLGEGCQSRQRAKEDARVLSIRRPASLGAARRAGGY